MPQWTEEPWGLQIVNNINPSTFGSMVSNFCWFFGSVTLTLADYNLLMGTTEQHRQAGLFLAGILVGSWTGKTIAGVVDAQQKRTADPRYKEVLEAKERGKVAGASAAVVIKESAKDAAAAREILTGEHAAIPPKRRSQMVGVIPDEPVSDDPGAATAGKAVE